jgi:hypothetical protein
VAVGYPHGARYQIKPQAGVQPHVGAGLPACSCPAVRRRPTNVQEKHTWLCNEGPTGAWSKGSLMQQVASKLGQPGPAATLRPSTAPARGPSLNSGHHEMTSAKKTSTYEAHTRVHSALVGWLRPRVAPRCEGKRTQRGSCPLHAARLNCVSAEPGWAWAHCSGQRAAAGHVHA